MVPSSPTVLGVAESPRAEGPGPAPVGSAAPSEPLVLVKELAVHFPLRAGLFGRASGVIRAVDGVSFRVGRAETVALVGESGCGKSTTARSLVRLAPTTHGRIELFGVDLARAAGVDLARIRRGVQMIFQDPYASLDPRMTVLESVAEPLVVHRLAKSTRAAAGSVTELALRVGLSEEHLGRYPHELSGGQRQRVGIARALALGPSLIVADEPTSALDVSIRAQILNLFVELQRERSIAYLFITHDLATVRRLASRVLVMYLGRVVESAPADTLFRRPAHPYTQALLAAVPTARPTEERARRRLPLSGEPPSPISPPAGCAFHPRCPHAFDRCRVERPALRARGAADAAHEAACHLEELAAS